MARWAVRHGMPAAYLTREARRGDLVARLLRDPALRADPHTVHEQLRARGPLVGSALGPLTTSHAVASEVLRSDRFGVGFDWSAAPGPVRRDLQTLRGFERLPVTLRGRDGAVPGPAGRGGGTGAALRPG